MREEHAHALATVLRRIVPAMFRHQQPWALLGSTSSCLQGLDVEPPDIDIATTLPGAYLMAGCLIDYMQRPVRYGETEHYASHFGVFEVEGVRVEIMGDLVIRGDGGVIEAARHFARWNDKVRLVKIDHLTVPCVPLEWQLVANMIIGRYERVERIAEHFRTHPFDRHFVEDICRDEYLKAPVRERIEALVLLQSRSEAGDARSEAAAGGG